MQRLLPGKCQDGTVPVKVSSKVQDMLLTFSRSFEMWCHMELGQGVCWHLGSFYPSSKCRGQAASHLPFMQSEKVQRGAHCSAKEFRDQIKSFNRATVTGEKVENVHTGGTFQSQTQVSILVISKWVCMPFSSACVHEHSIDSFSLNAMT